MIKVIAGAGAERLADTPNTPGNRELGEDRQGGQHQGRLAVYKTATR
jgi:hypothetical protein